MTPTFGSKLTPMSVASAASIALTCTGAGAAVGTVGAAFNNNPMGPSAINGARVGSAVAAVGGLFVAIFSAKNRETALETVGIAVGAIIVEGLL